jgi:hypothetical protein
MVSRVYEIDSLTAEVGVFEPYSDVHQYNPYQRKLYGGLYQYDLDRTGWSRGTVQGLYSGRPRFEFHTGH